MDRIGRNPIIVDHIGKPPIIVDHIGRNAIVVDHIGIEQYYVCDIYLVIWQNIKRPR